MTDEALLQAWSGGDQRAGHELFKRYHKPITYFFMRRVSVDADDLVQTTFLGLLKNVERFHGDNFRAYLFGVARNVLLKHLRNSKQELRSVDPEQATVADLDPSWVARRVIHEQNKVLVAALRRLTIDTQIMIELFYWERMSIKEIAEVIGAKPNSVAVRIHRARKKLDEEIHALANSQQELRTTLHRLSVWEAEVHEHLEELVGHAQDESAQP